MSDEAFLSPAPGFVAPDVLAELPGLRLDWVTATASLRPSPSAVKQRLRLLSNRYRGASVVAMRTHAIPHAYRAFYRQVGLDPDATRVPSEDVAVTRLLHGGFRSRNLIEDALLIALIETGVPVWALDADRVEASGLGIRTSVAGDRLGSGEEAPTLAPGRLVVADVRHVHGILFGELASEHQVGGATARVALFSVGVQGVPAIHIEEALWLCVETLQTSAPG